MAYVVTRGDLDEVVWGPAFGSDAQARATTFRGSNDTLTVREVPDDRVGSGQPGWFYLGSGATAQLAFRHVTIPEASWKADQKRLVYEHCQAGYAANLSHWPDLASTTANARGVSRWIWFTGAALDLQIDGQFRAQTGGAIVTLPRETVALNVVRFGETMRGRGNDAPRRSVQWWYEQNVDYSGFSVADNSRIYTDMLDRETGVIMHPFNSAVDDRMEHNRIPATFTTERPTLRTEP